MIYVYLIYGLSFFILWTVLWVYYAKLGPSRVSRNLWMIGLFAVTHGMSDWINMLIAIQGLHAPAFRVTSLVLLIVSFLFLVEFGIHTIASHRRPAMISLLPSLVLVPLAVLIDTSREPFLIGEIGARYLLGIPGSLLTSSALALQIRDIRKIQHPGLVPNLKVASFGFFFYAVFTGFIVPEAPFFPASVLNYRTFLSLTGAPVEFFRAVCVVIITYAMTRLLHGFEVQQTRSMIRTNQELEARVKARTGDLRSLNEALRQRELQQKAILDNIPDMAWLKDEECRFIMVNEPFAQLAGTSSEQLAGKTDLDVWPGELAERYRSDDKEVMVSRRRKQLEEPLIDKDGGQRWIETVKTPIYNERGEVIGTTGISRDVTERRKATEAINAERSFRKAIEDSIPAGIAAVDLDGRQSYVNPAFCKMVGWSEQELLGAEPPFVYWPPEDVEIILEDFRQSLSGTAVLGAHELRFMRRSGERFDVLIETSHFTDGTGNKIGLLASITDITDRKRVTEALRESEERYRAITESATDGIVTVDEQSTIIFANPAVEAIFGYKGTELEGRSLAMLMPERLRERHRTSLKKHVATGKRTLPWGAVELPGLHKDGREIALEMSYGEYVRNGKLFFTGIVRDITVRKEMESALGESERLRQMIMDAVPALISYVDRDLRYRFVNRQYEMWWKRPASDFIGRHVKDILGEKRYETAERHIKDVLQGQVASYEWLVPRDNDERHVQVVYVPHKSPDGRVLGFFSMINDITELKRAEKAIVESEKRIQLIIDAVPAMISYVGTDLRYQFVNRQYEEWFRVPAADIIGKHVMEMLGETRYREIEDFTKRALRGERISYERDIVLEHEQRYLHIDYVPHRGANREILGFFTLITDITGRKKIEERLQSANAKLSDVLNSITEAYYAFDSEWRIVEMNKEAEKLMGPSGELLGKVYWERFPQSRGTEIERQYRRAFREKQPVHFEGRSGITRRWYEIHAYPRGARLEVYFRDITERKRLEEIVQHRANHDALTDLPNRLLFEDILKVELAQARRNRKKIAVLYLDLDRFKDINDTMGHDAGDELLKQVAERLRKSVRESDTVARIGGDEFNVVLSDITAVGKARAAAEKIVAAFQESHLVADKELHVTTSIGISIYPDDSLAIETLLKYADMAMYHAKQTGRNRYQFYDQTINRRTLEHTIREKRLRDGLENGELVVHYLPEVDARTRKLVGAEALIRWKHPKLGLLMPARFMPLAEETGLILPIGDWILRTVTHQLKAWQQAGYEPISVTVNLSDRQFHQRDLAETTGKILQEAGLEPRWLEFDISEPVALTDLEFTGPHLQKLAEAGVGTTLDNFGTGRLSLNQLKKLPFSKLKIDRSLIQSIISDPADRMVVEAMIAMTHLMKIKAAAEGVETEEQFELLRECDELEGYVFSQPQPAEEFEKMLVTTGG